MGSVDDGPLIVGGSFNRCNVKKDAHKCMHLLLLNFPINVRLFAVILICLVFTSFTIFFLSGVDEQHRDKWKISTTINGHNMRFKRIASFIRQNSCTKLNKILEKEEIVFQSIRQDHIKLIERYNVINENMEAILREIPMKETELKELQLRIDELRLLQHELNDRRNVRLKLPNPPLFFTERDQTSENISTSQLNVVFKSIEHCVDYRCSISSIFHVYLYEPQFSFSNLSKNLFNEISASKAVTKNADEACIFVAILENDLDGIKSLKYWRDVGRNHLILLVNPTNGVKIVNANAAMIVTSNFFPGEFRKEMDIALHLNVPQNSLIQYQRLPQLLPYTRENLISFFSGSSGISTVEKATIDALMVSMQNSNDSYLININCVKTNFLTAERMPLCYDEKQRVSLIRRSFFSLLFVNCPSFQQRFYEALLAGSVPVVLSTSEAEAPLPFQDFIDWRLASIRIAAARLPELHFVLRSIVTSDLLEIRRKGRFFLENYLSNTRNLSRAILSYLRYRLQALSSDPSFVNDKINVQSPSSTYMVTATRPPYDDEYLGIVETPTSSPQFMHNMTVTRMYSYKLWNELPLHIEFMPEFLETNYALPSEAEFDSGSSYGMRPIAPGSGQEFVMGLGGNRPREQFTIVIATYNRDAILNASLERLHMLPYLNRIIVAWNNVDRSPNQSIWPRLHVPILFVNFSKNSLNNRFIPFKEIETDAVLSLDDDIDIKQYEIIFAFRTWREQRHRIVGFPARYHAKYGDSMFYNSNHTCQLSMILTGAAFLHKSYFYAYTHIMPEIIRKKVDEWMNCEDLAMNFLVSHFTRQPPIKTTSKWTLRCPTCSETLSNDESHFNKRHKCIRFFTQVYGYNPLLFSQFRVDSVLFKTRVPPNHQKCFRYV